MKEIIAAHTGDVTVVAAGKSLHFGDWKLFPDFLGAYLGGCLNPKWGEPQLRLPIEQQHPINQWYTLMVESQKKAERTKDGFVVCNTGAAMAWVRLAYDLYLIEHNGELQSRLLRKLRYPDQFQGARFEAAVAAMMLAAGYELAYSEDKGPGKRPEFIATNKMTGARVAVEAKSRHRPGILGYLKHHSPTYRGDFDITSLLKSAVEKDTSEPLIVFIELNAPVELSGATQSQVYKELNDSWNTVQSLEWPDGFPCIAVVFYNDINPWFLSARAGEHGAPIWVMALWPTAARHEVNSRELVEKLVNGCATRTKIPLEFPGGEIKR
jgi:hypothetical protein